MLFYAWVFFRAILSNLLGDFNTDTQKVGGLGQAREEFRGVDRPTHWLIRSLFPESYLSGSKSTVTQRGQQSESSGISKCSGEGIKSV